MAEAMELDLSLNQPGKQPIENPVPVPQESIEIEKIQTSLVNSLLKSIMRMIAWVQMC